MKELIKYIQTMQGALIGILFISCILAFVVVLAIAVNKIAPIIIAYLASNDAQYDLMKQFYPELRALICDLKLAVERVQSNQLYTGLRSSVDRYIDYEKDPERYRCLYKEELPMIDSFYTAMREATEKFAEISEYLLTHTLPVTPVFRPFLKRKVSRMLAELYRYALMWYVYHKKEVCMEALHKKYVSYHRKYEKKLDEKKLDRYLKVLDLWYKKY